MYFQIGIQVLLIPYEIWRNLYLKCISWQESRCRSILQTLHCLASCPPSSALNTLHWVLSTIFTTIFSISTFFGPRNTLVDEVSIFITIVQCQSIFVRLQTYLILKHWTISCYFLVHCIDCLRQYCIFFNIHHNIIDVILFDTLQPLLSESWSLHIFIHIILHIINFAKVLNPFPS